jgi:hypothetical protein
MIRRAPVLITFGALVASLAAAASAAAHMATAPVVAVSATAPPAPASAALPGTASGFYPAWVGMILLVVAQALGMRRTRRSIAFLLCLVLGMFAFEAGMHSVHHLGAGDSGTTHCAIASATAHGPEAIFESVTVAPVSEPQWLVSADDGCRAAWILLRPDSGRAPPTLA